MQGALYRTIWRWHFYAGLFVIPFVLLLSVTGAFYLFKPQVDRWEERAFQGLPMSGAVSPNAQLDAALAAYPGAQFHSYRLPEQPGDAAMIHLALPEGRKMVDVFVSPQGKVLGSLDPDSRIMMIDHRIHGQLLLGRQGSWIVELAASWALVLVLSGLYLWWPRGGGGLAGTLWPRLRSGKKLLLRDLHAVTGFWVAGLTAILLITALPWTHAWGNLFRAIRTNAGWVTTPQDWTLGGKAPGGGSEHAEHDHAAMLKMQAAGIPLTSLGDVVAKAEALKLPFPVIVAPPGAPGQFGAPPAMEWIVRSDTQNRPLRVTVKYDMATGKQLSREEIGDKHVIDQVVSYGVAWHEGQLFGWVNQLIGLLTAAALLLMSVTAFLMWRARKPADALGAPARSSTPARIAGPAIIFCTLAVLLPLLAASAVVLTLFEKFALPRLPKMARWLGV